MKLSEELKWRGFLNQTTFSNLSQLDKKKHTFYHGFDASADSQTVGNLAGMMLDRLLMKHGHRAVILAGGATSLIGDPGGKDAERPLQDERTVARNVARAEEQLKKVFRGHSFKLVNNLSWTKNLRVIDYLRDYGKHFSMTPLIQRDFIAKRLGTGGSGISYAEFSYTVLQGLDYLHLYDNYGVTLQLGGSDQWGNLLSGVELIRRTRGVEVHALTMPLVVNKATGKKFGKTEAGAVWLDPQKTSPVQFYQFWLNTSDEDAVDYLKIYTEIEPEEIGRLIESRRRRPQAREAQHRLAEAVTKIVHSPEAAQRAQVIGNVLTGRTEIGPVPAAAIREMLLEINHAKSKPGTTVIELLVASKLAPSNSEARRLVSSGAVYINNQPAKKELVEASDFQKGRLLLRRGKAYKDTALILEA